MEKKGKKHFILVHGACHGAWCWYKIAHLLKSDGHQVTALDLGACGVNPKKLEEVTSFSEYVKPLMEVMASLSSDEKIILVGHSFGGFSISFAMEKFPAKILVAVFVTAYMPNCKNPPATLIGESVLQVDTNRFPVGVGVGSSVLMISALSFTEKISVAVFLTAFLPDSVHRPSFVLEKDLELAKILARPPSLFQHDLSMAKEFSSEGHGSVRKVYIICEEDKAIPKEFQEWMIENNPVEEVIKMEGVDHMPTFCKP
ncbi:hypothetical protein JCGZ_12330 [Jatropha curcas]|uniref:AB hydrolase-1 domain-containing protein n=1 Tax=Jatropha curcas TaxID=180498 RepID=A0A067KJ55_JATCU|nr:hypothetical protein JCGZ_12330 [Jatropha curcas]